ncbi:MAG: sulfite exporter TauE/SafE family protein [Acidobacteriota bacterium]
MSPLAIVHLLAAAGAAFLAGGINSVAGGGTMISFPALLALGLASIAANATSTVAIWPGSLGSLWGFRRELAAVPRPMLLLAFPALLGGLAGALLLRRTPEKVFDHLIPFLLLFATVLFAIQAPVQRRLRARAADRSLAGPHGGDAAPDTNRKSSLWITTAALAQFAVGIYGGYFGAGMSIMMLTLLAYLGMDDILKMNAMTSFLSLCTNGVAAVLFAAAHMVVWSYVVAMMAAALLGGYGAAGVARKVGRVIVRRFVIVVGFTIAVVLFVKMF